MYQYQRGVYDLGTKNLINKQTILNIFLQHFYEIKQQIIYHIFEAKVIMNEH